MGLLSRSDAYIGSIQHLLQDYGYSLTVTGIWDSSTQEAWDSFCLKNNLPLSGGKVPIWQQIKPDLQERISDHYFTFYDGEAFAEQTVQADNASNWREYNKRIEDFRWQQQNLEIVNKIIDDQDALNKASNPSTLGPVMVPESPLGSTPRLALVRREKRTDADNSKVPRANQMQPEGLKPDFLKTLEERIRFGRTRFG